MQVKWIAILSLIFELIACGGNRPPLAIIDLPQGSVAATGEIQVDASASRDPDGEVVSYLWDFGDGTKVLGLQAQHYYTKSGQYNLTLTVTDDEGSKATQSLSISVNITNFPPVAIINASALYGIAPLQVTFNGGGSSDREGGIATYEWRSNDALIATGASLTYSFTEPGKYHLQLKVTDFQGASNTTVVAVTVAKVNGGYRLQGRIVAAPFTDIDSDVNNPDNDLIGNDGTDENAAQVIGNPVILNGFVSSRATGVAGEVFAERADKNDFYSVYLYKDQYVSLQVVNSAGADIDLYLLDATTSDVLVTSTTNNEFESVRAERDGVYYVLVSAIVGQSKYLLKVGDTSFAPITLAAGQSTDFEPEQLIIKGRNGLAPKSLKRAQLRLSHYSQYRAALARLNLLNPQTTSELRISNQDSVWLARLATKNPRSAAKIRTLMAMKHLQQEADIDYAEPNYRVHSQLVPNDPLYSYQWHLPALNLPQVWDKTLGSDRLVIAVIDSGIYKAHPDLSQQLLPGYDFIADPKQSGDGDGLDADPTDSGESTAIGGASWHGTHVTGIIAARMDNREGGVGVAPGTKVMPVRAIGLGGGNTYDVMQAVRYAAGLENDSGTLPAKAADIINMSIGGGGYLESGQELFNQLRELGIFVVAASGNGGGRDPLYPACYHNVISVAGTDLSGTRASYSNFGPFVDVAAPGGNLKQDLNRDGYEDGILSTSARGQGGTAAPNYVFFQGTSMSSPIVTGILALMKSVYPELTPAEFDSLLASGVMTSDLGEPGRDDFYGHGFIDAFLATRAAQNLADGGETAAIVAEQYALTFDDLSSELTLTLNRLGTSAISVVESSVSESWLTLQPNKIDDDGLGEYRVRVNRDNLADGNYRGYIEFTANSDQIVRIQVFMRVGERVASGDAGYLYVFLFAGETGEVVDVKEVTENQGEYFYQFENLAPGEYKIAAGSDIDNDGIICDLGESCGYYPDQSSFTLIPLYENRINVNFWVGLLGGASLDSGTTNIMNLQNDRSVQ